MANLIDNISLDSFYDPALFDEDDYKETEVIDRGSKASRRPAADDIAPVDRLRAFAGANLSAPHRGLIIVADRSYSVDRVMDAINAGLHALAAYVAEDPSSASTVDIALISFGTDVTVHRLRTGGVVSPDNLECAVEDIFVSGKEFPRDFKLEARGLTALNDALVTACDLERIYAHYITNKTRQSPRKTVVMLLTDGRDEPGGDISAAAERVAELVENDRILFLPFGYGSYSKDEFAHLCRANGEWYEVTDTSGDKIVDVFKLIGASMRKMSYDGSENTEHMHFESMLGDNPQVKTVTLDEFLASHGY